MLIRKTQTGNAAKNLLKFDGTPLFPERIAYTVPYKLSEAIFTEHRGTLNYLKQRMSTLLGRPEAIVCIHAGMGREDRMTAQETFRHDPDVRVLLATDAAGEGINSSART